MQMPRSVRTKTVFRAASAMDTIASAVANPPAARSARDASRLPGRNGFFAAAEGGGLAMHEMPH
jgi:hypothetical protein